MVNGEFNFVGELASLSMVNFLNPEKVFNVFEIHSERNSLRLNALKKDVVLLKDFHAKFSKGAKIAKI